jgi:hypothetical protein
MPSPRRPTFLDKIWVALLALLVLAFLAHLYFLSSFSIKPPSNLPTQTVADLRIAQLQAAITRLELENAPVPRRQTPILQTSSSLEEYAVRSSENRVRGRTCVQGVSGTGRWHALKDVSLIADPFHRTFCPRLRKYD